jgi:hypothetical protein
VRRAAFLLLVMILSVAAVATVSWPNLTGEPTSMTVLSGDVAPD